MVQIVLTDEQAKILEEAKGAVEIRDPKGNWLGRVDPVEAAFVAEYKRRGKYKGLCYSGAQVQSRLQALQAEWDRLGGFDDTYMIQFLARLDETDPGHMRPKE